MMSPLARYVMRGGYHDPAALIAAVAPDHPLAERLEMAVRDLLAGHAEGVTPHARLLWRLIGDEDLRLRHVEWAARRRAGVPS